MDVTDMVDYNLGLLNHNDLANNFFCLSNTDPTAGFAFDHSSVAGQTYPEISSTPGKPDIHGTPPQSKADAGRNVGFSLIQR